MNDFATNPTPAATDETRLQQPDGTTSRRPTASYRLSRRIILQLLGLLYVCSFLSLGTQVQGLIGEQGLMPARDFIAKAYRTEGDAAFLSHPSLLMFSNSDGLLTAIWVIGTVCAISATLGWYQLLCFFTCWVLYLSLVVVGQEFTGGVGDAMMLELGWVGLFLCPLAGSPRLGSRFEPLPVARWIVWTSLLRITFVPAAVRLGGDPSWRDGGSLSISLLTQPLPTWVAWYAARVPDALFGVAVWAGFFIALVAPFAVFGGKYGRRTAAVLLAIPPLLAALTGNDGVAPFVRLILVASLLDDDVWRWFGRLVGSPFLMIRQMLHFRPSTNRPATRPIIGDTDAILPSARGFSRMQLPVLLLMIFVGFAAACRDLRRPIEWAGPLAGIDQAARTLRIVADLGEDRPPIVVRTELVIEGSRDGQSWRQYDFQYKPADLARRPALLGPHLPRLDASMATVAAGREGGKKVLDALLNSLIEGRKPVFDLMVADSSRIERPAFVRVRAFNYRFATRDPADEGLWWRREYVLDVRQMEARR